MKRSTLKLPSVAGRPKRTGDEFAPRLHPCCLHLSRFHAGPACLHAAQAMECEKWEEASVSLMQFEANLL